MVDLDEFSNQKPGAVQQWGLRYLHPSSRICVERSPILGRIYILHGHNRIPTGPACLNESLARNRQIAAVFYKHSYTGYTMLYMLGYPHVFTPPIKNIKKPPLMSRNVITSEHQGLSEFTSKIYSLFLCLENTSRHLVQLINLNPKTPKTQTGHVKNSSKPVKLC